MSSSVYEPLDFEVAAGVEALLGSDAMTPNHELPTHYYVDEANVEYLVRVVLHAARSASSVPASDLTYSHPCEPPGGFGRPAPIRPCECYAGIRGHHCFDYHPKPASF